MIENVRQTRRSFLRAAARLALLGGLGGLGVTLARRDPACRRPDGCGGCARYAQCALPQKAARP
ncbi:MAG: hypothetical protein NTV49_03130 [Kiritimatiellaeota bacterium]|nr:hypothetical protein [Kiritimatiellota bacterium]